MLSFNCLSGQDDSHIASISYGSGETRVLPDLESPLLMLADAAKLQGFELKIVSGYRNFERQMAIWNAKAQGLRPVLDADERPIAPGSLTGWPLAQAILRWSALPGASRHHWGSEIDIVDGAALTGGYEVQLTQQEAAPGGVFESFHQWLDRWLVENPEAGFGRPYWPPRANVSSREFGVSPEPWHLSYRPVSEDFARGYDLGQLADLISRSPIELKTELLEHLDEIFDRFILVKDF